MTAAIVDLADLKGFMRKSVDESDNDPELQQALDAAHVVAAHRTSGALADLDRPMRVRSRRGRLTLPLVGLVGDVEVRDPRGNLVPIDPDDVDLGAGIIDLGWSNTRAWYEVTVTVDDDDHSTLELAVLIIAKHLYGERMGNLTGPARGANSNNQNQPQSVPVGYAVPRRAAELLAPYSVPIGFAGA